MSREILDCLKRKQDICIQNIIPSQNTAFMFIPALTTAGQVFGLFLPLYCCSVFYASTYWRRKIIFLYERSEKDERDFSLRD